MGKQVQFHMLAEDMKMLLDFVQSQDDIVITHLDSDSPKISPILEPVKESSTLVLWNTRLLPLLERKLVHRSGGSDYYRVDYSMPTIELSPSRLTKWMDEPALLQGRLYMFFNTPVPDYEAWYQTIARRIRRDFIKNPLTLLKGYVGPKTFEWYRKGGILLPMFEPPLTPEWLSFIKNQHAISSPS